jgi:serine/threonine protein kinase
MTDAGRSSEDPSIRVDYLALPVGTMVGRYEILGVLGQGGFGITYLARDRQLGRDVAVKEYLPMALAVRQDGRSVLPRSTAVADDFGWGRGRFIEEGRTLATLHEAPSIVRVFDFLEANGTAYIVMELVRGETLEERIENDGPLAPAAFEAILWPLLAGLQQVHEAGFLHRDIKPANIMLGPDKATLIDFGASRAAMADRTRTMTAIFTPGYAAPEQFAAVKLGPWTDIYGLAATLHYAITGKAPPSAIDRLMQDTYARLVILQPEGHSRGILAGIDAGLSIRTDERPQTIALWRRLLRQHAPPGATTMVMAPRRRKMPVAGASSASGKARWLVLAAAFALLGAGGYYVLTTRQSPTGDESRRALQEAEAGRQKAEAIAEQLKTDATQREAAGQARRTADAEATRARQLAAADAQAKREAAEKSKIEEEARARAVPSAPAGFDGTYRGGLSETATVGGRFISVMLQLAGATLSGEVVYQRCGPFPVSLAVSPSGEISGAVRLPDTMACAPTNGTASGRVTSQGLQLEVRGLGIAARGALTKATAEPTPMVAPVLPPAAPTPTPASTIPASPVAPASTIEGVYVGSLPGSTPGGGQGLRSLRADLRVSGGRLTGQLVQPGCGVTSISLPVDPTGAFSGAVRIYEPIACSMNDAAASGRVTANALTLDIRGITTRAQGSLSRRAE